MKEKKEDLRSKIEELVNPEEFRVPATDLKGHTRKCQFYAIPSLLNEINYLVSQKIFPYRTRGDFYRHAIVRHAKYLERLAKQVGEVKSITAEVDAIREILQREEHQREIGGIVEKTRLQVSDLLSYGADAEARKLVLKIRRHIKSMPEGFWRDKFLSEIDTHFKYLLDGTEKASLLKLSSEE